MPCADGARESTQHCHRKTHTLIHLYRSLLVFSFLFQMLSSIKRLFELSFDCIWITLQIYTVILLCKSIKVMGVIYDLMIEIFSVNSIIETQVFPKSCQNLQKIKVNADQNYHQFVTDFVMNVR